MTKDLENHAALRAYVESLRPIPAGTFQMGTPNGHKSQKPVHSVTLSAFRMGATPVTVALWREYCEATNKPMPSEPDWGWRDDHPVVSVSWTDIMGTYGEVGFCAWASDIAGFGLTLPTEAQFEYAACGAQSSLQFPWGDTFDDSKVWCSEKPYIRHSTAPVVRSSNIFINSFGLTDMSGNVYQWCFDYFGKYSKRPTTNPVGPSWGEDGHCVRAGYYGSPPENLGCAWRSWNYAHAGGCAFGFRLAAGPG
jgi:formylglycine-generating enzyme required for sulfatase activity